jgi:hypothetical protein
MSFKIDDYSIIPISKRPKLYKEMEINPYGLSKLDLSKLFTYMDEKNEHINTIIRNDFHKVMKFKYYGEFLNVINFSVLFYKLNFDMVFENKINYSKVLFLLDISTLFFLIFVFLIYNKNKIIMSKIKLIMLFGVVSIFLSKYITLINEVEKSIHKFINYRHLTYMKKRTIIGDKFISDSFDNLEPTLDYLKINYFFFLAIFLFLNDYLVNNETSNIFSSLLIIILILIISIIHEQIFMKIRCMFIGINIFELIPKIRKFANSISEKFVKMTYLINSIICAISLLYIDELNTLIRIFIINVLFIVFYPIIFNYYYHKEKLFMKGMWDCPDLTKFQ